LLGEIGVDYRVEEMVVYRVVHVRILIIVTPEKYLSMSKRAGVDVIETDHRVRYDRKKT
jgi:hypothetical protein